MCCAKTDIYRRALDRAKDEIRYYIPSEEADMALSSIENVENEILDVNECDSKEPSK